MSSTLPEVTTVDRDIVFGHGGNVDLHCDIYRPALDCQKRTAVIHLHGGGFRVGSKQRVDLARPLAALGYTSVAAQYRLLQEDPWPAQVEDAYTCLNWVRTNAPQLHVDPEKTVLLGYSAGGQLALIAAGVQNAADKGSTVPGTPAACVAFYPPVTVVSIGDGDANTVSRGRGSIGPAPNPSPLAHVRPGFPPTILLHGVADRTVPVEETMTLFAALRGANVPVEMHLIEGVTHIFDTHAVFAQASAQWIDLFLDRHVVNPRAYPSTEPIRNLPAVAPAHGSAQATAER